MQTAGLLNPSNKSLLSLEVIASGPGGGPELVVVQRRGHLPLREAAVIVQKWATGQQKAQALLQGWAAPEFCFAPVEKEEQLGLSGSGLLVTWGKVCAGVSVDRGLGFSAPRGCVACPPSWVRECSWRSESLSPDLFSPFLAFPSSHCLLFLCFSEVLVFVLTFLQ